jgi:hypothetical protein
MNKPSHVQLPPAGPLPASIRDQCLFLQERSRSLLEQSRLACARSRAAREWARRAADCWRQAPPPPEG